MRINLAKMQQEVEYSIIKNTPAKPNTEEIAAIIGAMKNIIEEYKEKFHKTSEFEAVSIGD